MEQRFASPSFWAATAVISGVAAALLSVIHVWIESSILVDCIGEGCVEKILASEMAGYWYLRLLSNVFAIVSMGSLGMTIVTIIRKIEQRRANE